MPQWIGQQRRDFLINVMVTIHARRYIYDPGQRGYAPGGAVPAPGSRMNCEGAALLMKDLAINMSPPGALLPLHLRIVSVQAQHRILFRWRPNMTPALGGPTPAYVQNIGWVFENHYRLRDAGDGNRLYDPVFRTVSPGNYDGIKGSAATMVTQNGQIVAEVFGERYLVITQGLNRDLFELNQNQVHARFVVADGDFI